MRWLPWAVNHPVSLVPPGILQQDAPARFCIVVALGGQYGADRFPWVATLCGDQPRLTSPVCFGARPPTELPARCARCDEMLAEQDRVSIDIDPGTFEAGFRCGLAEGKAGE